MNKNMMWIGAAIAAWWVFIRRDELGSTMWENFQRPAEVMR